MNKHPQFQWDYLTTARIYSEMDTAEASTSGTAEELVADKYFSSAFSSAAPASSFQLHQLHQLHQWLLRPK